MEQSCSIGENASFNPKDAMSAEIMRSESLRSSCLCGFSGRSPLIAAPLRPAYAYARSRTSERVRTGRNGASQIHQFPPSCISCFVVGSTLRPSVSKRVQVIPGESGFSYTIFSSSCRSPGADAHRHQVCTIEKERERTG